MDLLIANVILSTVHPDVDKVFDYLVQEPWKEKIQVGMRVIVPFGNRSKGTEGYVIGLSRHTEIAAEKLKPILNLPDTFPVFSQSMIDLALWMKEKYYTTLTQCLQTIMPSGMKTKNECFFSLKCETVPLTEEEKEVLLYLKGQPKPCSMSELEEIFGKNIHKWTKALAAKGAVSCRYVTQKSVLSRRERMVYFQDGLDPQSIRREMENYKLDKRKQQQWNVLDCLMKEGALSVAKVKSKTGAGDSSIQTLVKKGILKLYFTEVQRNPFEGKTYEPSKPLVLNEEQQAAFENIKKVLEAEEKKPILLQGVTGSGKTEVYLQAIDTVLKKGRQAIVLVPEISLTPQTVERFIRRFGNLVSVTHSKMNLGERYDQWVRARSGEIAVMIGPRSAVFTPFERLGIIIIDEEHENTYQSETTPKYDAREVARKRCSQEGALLLMGTATPSVKTYFSVIQGEFDRLYLKERVHHAPLPEMIVQDMRRELEEGNRSVFSRKLFIAMKTALDQKEQILLFLNRRGFSTFVSCRKCGYVMKCDACNVSYTYHAAEKELICHYCGKKAEVPKICPSCGSSYIKFFGTGTQKIEAEVKKLFPKAKVLRMDMDTTSKKHSHERILNSFAKREADILIGTQMIAKGHDFPGVTLVGILAADLSLFAGDYRSGETTFQLLTQVAGRAGRGEKPGKVIVQTYQPEHYSIQYAAKQDTEGFYQEELALRKTLGYPPYSHIFQILITSIEEEAAEWAAVSLRQVMDKENKESYFQLLGPAPAVISKINHEYRFRLLALCAQEVRLRKYVLSCVETLRKSGLKKSVFIHLSLDPVVIV